MPEMVIVELVAPAARGTERASTMTPTPHCEPAAADRAQGASLREFLQTPENRFVFSLNLPRYLNNAPRRTRMS
jgi:hypothetical protein